MSFSLVDLWCFLGYILVGSGVWISVGAWLFVSLPLQSFGFVYVVIMYTCTFKIKKNLAFFHPCFEGSPGRALHLVSEPGFYTGNSGYISTPIKPQVGNLNKWKQHKLALYNLDYNLCTMNIGNERKMWIKESLLVFSKPMLWCCDIIP